MRDNVDIGALSSDINRARLALQKPREAIMSMVREYVGPYWSWEANPRSVPCNLIALYISIVIRKLIANNPRAMLSTDEQDARPVVAAEEEWINQKIEDIDLAEVLEEAALNALFSMAVVQVALTTPAEAVFAGETMGEPTVTNIDFDDFVYDTHSRKFRRAHWMGHRFRIPLDAAKKMFASKELAATDDRLFNAEGDERLNVLGRTTLSGETEEYTEFVDLWQIYMVDKKLIIILTDNQLMQGRNGKGWGKALKIQKWVGPPCGPYHILALGPAVPGNPMPKGPVQDLYDLHLALNSICRKLIMQAQRQKEVTAYKGSAADEADRWNKTNDGHGFRCDDPEGIRLVKSGGPDQQNHLLFQSLNEIFSKHAGNLNMLGGLSPESKTATQDKMLNQNAAGQVGDMQQRMLKFTSEVIDALCWFYHYHPYKTMRTSYHPRGMPELATPINIYPNNPAVHGNHPDALVRKHSYEDMKVRIDPYSLQYQTPETRVQALNSIVQQTIMPMMQLMQQQGIQFDLRKYLKLVGHYLDLPDLDEIMTISEPIQEESDPESAGVEGGMPPNTERTYTRRSIGSSPQGQQNAITQQLLKPQSNGQQNGQMVGA